MPDLILIVRGNMAALRPVTWSGRDWLDRELGDAAPHAGQSLITDCESLARLAESAAVNNLTIKE